MRHTWCVHVETHECSCSRPVVTICKTVYVLEKLLMLITNFTFNGDVGEFESISGHKRCLLPGFRSDSFHTKYEPH